MILMWLGSFVLMMWGLSSFQKHFAQAFSGFQKSLLEKPASKSLLGLVTNAALLDLTEASPLRSLYSAMGLLNLRILPTRQAVLMMCLSPLALIPVLMLGSLYLNFSGFFILGICSIGLVRFWKPSAWDQVIQIFFSVGIFLIGGESLLRNSAVMQTYLAQGDLVYFLADGRFGAVLTLALVSFLASFLIQVEFWSLAFALSLLSTGALSFNGALGLVLGERLAVAVLFWFRTRRLNQECRSLGKQYSILIAASSVIGFWFAGESRNLWNLGFSVDISAVQEKSFSFLVVFAVMIATQWLAGMIWGHFAGNSTTDEMQDPLYFSKEWMHRCLLSEGQKAWAKDKVQKRLSEIRYHLAGLKSLKDGQVPDHIRTRLIEEERQLAELGI